jgi:hypothetical protein
VVKIHVPGPLYMTKEEANGVLSTVSIVFTAKHYYEYFAS